MTPCSATTVYSGRMMGSCSWRHAAARGAVLMVLWGGACRAPAEEPVIAGCLVGGAAGSGAVVDLLYQQAVLVDVDRSRDTMFECLGGDVFGDDGWAQSGEEGDRVFARLEGADGLDLVAGFFAPGVELALELGSEVEFSYYHRFGEGEASSVDVSVRVKDELILWSGRNTTVERLRTPEELALEEGAREARDGNQCAKWWQMSLLASSGLESVEVSYGAGAPLAGGTVVNGGVEVLKRTTGRCDDGVLTDAAAAWWRTE